MESMVKILNKCLKDSNLETISKGELRKKYLEKTGLKRLPKEDKELFSSAVDTAFLNFISNETKAVGNMNDTKIVEASDNKIKENGGDGEFVTDSSSDEEITSANINKYVLAGQFANGVNDIKMESTSDSDEKSLASYKNIADKKSSNDLEKQRGKRSLSSSSEDETIQNKLTKRSQVIKKSRKSSEAERDANISKITKNKNCFKKAKVESSDSEDELLTVIQKKLNSCSGSKMSDLSENESLSKYSKKQLNNAINSDDEPVMPSNRKKANSVNGLKNNSSDSEDEPLTKFKKTSDSINSKGEKIKFKIKQRSNNYVEYMKSKKNCSDSEDEPLTKYKKAKDSIHSGENSNSFIKKSNSSNKPFKSTENPSDSEDEPVLSLKKKKSNLLYDSCISKNSSSESENESLAKYSKKVNNSIDSDEELASEKSNAINGLLKSSKNLRDSEDEPLNKLGNKKTGNSSDFEKEPVKKIVKGEVKHSLKKSITNGNKSKEQSIKIKKFVDSDDNNISNQNKRKSSFEQKNYLLSDSSEDEPNGQTFGKKKKRIVDSDNEQNIANQKKEKSFVGQNDSPISDSSEDEPLVKLKSKESNSSNCEDEPLVKLSSKTGNSSDSEDEPLDKLSNKTGNSSDNAKESVQKIVKVKHTLKKTKKSSKPNEQTFGKKKKRIVDSDNEVNIASQEKEKSFDGLKDFSISDSSEDEPLVNFSKESKNSSDSEDEPRDKLINKTDHSSDSEDESLDKLSNKISNSGDNVKQSDKKFMKEVKHTLKKTKKSSKPKDQTFGKKKRRIVDSDNEENIVNQKKEKSFNGQNDSPLSDSNEDEPLLNITQKEPKIASDSENEPLNKFSTTKSDKKQKSSESGSSSSVDENEEHSNKKNMLSERKEANDSGKGKKRPSASENKIEHLKKYVRVAGIRIQNYNKLFESCKTMKAKCEKLMSLLEKEGLKGRPTLEKCKKLKKKIETKREIAELDLSNILKEGGGRQKRSACSDTTNCKPEEETSAPIKKFSRLQDIFDSEESD